MNDAYFDENIVDDDIKKANKHSVSIPTLIISLITTIVIVVIVLNNWGNIKEMVGLGTDIVEDVQFEKLLVGDEVKLSGDIFDDGDLVNYTHVFDSKEYGEIGLKSQNINLNNYKGEVYLEGIVEKIYQGIPVVEIDTIYSVDDIKEEINEEIQEETGDVVETKYLPNAGLYFDGDFFEKYSFVNNGEDGDIKVKNLNTNEIININYFNCDTSITNQNCDRFNEMFATSSVEKFVDAAGIAYYKQSEVQSWFFSNASLYGYFINDTEDAQVKDLVKYITIVNNKYIEKNIVDNIKTICWKPGSAIKNVIDYKLFMKNNQLYLDVNGDDGVDSRLSCELKIDLGMKNMAKLLDLKLIGTGDIDEVKNDIEENLDNNEDVDADKDESSDKLDLVENTDWDSDVEQFPINLDKALEFTSRRGHTIVFPSSNIAYAGKSLQEDFGQKGVNCFSVMNVVKYSEKDVVDQKGSVKIYECSIKDGFDDSSEQLIHKTIGDKDFVIEITDPSRVQFANNINIIVK